MLNGLSMGAGELDLTAAQRLIDAASDSEDFREGRRAFREKRPPRFRGE
jgi:enoyl-CoA hydratase/carnithine racemase